MFLKLGAALVGALAASVASMLTIGFGNLATRPKVIVWPVICRCWRILLLILLVDLILSGIVVGSVIGATLSCSCFNPSVAWILPVEAIPYFVGGILGVLGLGLLPDNRAAKDLRDRILPREKFQNYETSSSQNDPETLMANDDVRAATVAKFTQSFSSQLAGEVVAVQAIHRRWKQSSLTSVREASESRYQSIKARWRDQLEQEWASSGRYNRVIMFRLISECGMQTSPEWNAAIIKAKEALDRLATASKKLGMSTKQYAESGMCLNLREQADPVFEILMNMQKFDFLADVFSVKLRW